MQEPELTARMLRKCLFQDRWLKDIAYQEWVLKDKLDKHYARSMACEMQLLFCVYVFLTKSNIGPYKSLKGPYLALVQVPGNRGPVKQNVYHHLLALAGAGIAVV